MSDENRLASVGVIDGGVKVNGLKMEYGAAILMALDILKIAQANTRVEQVTFNNDNKSSL